MLPPRGIDFQDSPRGRISVGVLLCRTLLLEAAPVSSIALLAEDPLRLAAAPGRRSSSLAARAAIELEIFPVAVCFVITSGSNLDVKAVELSLPRVNGGAVVVRDGKVVKIIVPSASVVSVVDGLHGNLKGFLQNNAWSMQSITEFAS